jgi:hypothetical protein
MGGAPRALTDLISQERSSHLRLRPDVASDMPLAEWLTAWWATGQRQVSEFSLDRQALACAYLTTPPTGTTTPWRTRWRRARPSR